MDGASGEDSRRLFASGELEDKDVSVEERECDVMSAPELTERGIVPLRMRDLGGVKGERDERGESEDFEVGDGELRPFDVLVVGLIGETALLTGGDVARVACDEEVA
jgi:hypothetical protein